MNTDSVRVSAYATSGANLGQTVIRDFQARSGTGLRGRHRLQRREEPMEPRPAL